MKFQPRRFVVEVKRGTNRAAFASPDTVSEKFSNAEDLLFGNAAKAVTPRPKAASSAPAGGGRRILESLIEPPPPSVEEVVEPPRRGRKPGSKNKPKPVATFAPATAILPSDVPPVVKRVPSAASSRRRAAIALDEAPGDAGTTTAVVPAPAPPSPQRTADADNGGDARVRRTRLRDRSSILKRYVLDTEPRPGQLGYLRSRRRG